MQSIYLYELKKKQSEGVLKSIINKSEIQERQTKSREILCRKHRKRMENLLISLPSEISLKPSKVIPVSTRNFYTNYSTEKQRLITAQSSHSWLDTTPTPKSSYILRKRERSKELNKDFRFKSSSSVERVSETREQQLTIYNTSENKNPMFSGGKTILQYYHPRAYSKTIESQKTLGSLNHIDFIKH